ncbi:MAG: sugar kinase [Pirellulales bacterium]|nr:sugar kinase [Pirellulales bacterium]
MNNPSKIVLFGELLMRLETPQQLRFVQTDRFDVGYTGGEANAGVLLSRFGLDAYLVSSVPDNDLGLACTNHMRRYGLDVRYVRRSGPRLGLYFLEPGGGHRATRVLYDRAGSSFAGLKPGDLPWHEILAGKDWFHFTGTAPALSPQLAALTLEGCRTARELGVTVSCDVNYRSALWSIAAAREAMSPIVRHVDVLVANEEHARQLLGAPEAPGECGDLFDPRRYEPVLRYLRDEFNLRGAALTIRAGDTADETTIAAVLADGGQIVGSRKYVIRPIDRIGGGDAFSGALIYGLLQGKPAQDVVELAVAASCLKHAVRGDFCHASLDEVESLARDGPDGRVRR